MSTHDESEKCQAKVQEEIAHMCERFFLEYQASPHVSRHVQGSCAMYF